MTNFFSEQPPLSEVPDDLLRATILTRLNHESRSTINFFAQYFKNPNHGAIHPVLGDLHEFANLVQDLETPRGILPLMLNSAANFIRAKINPDQSAFVPASSLL